MPVSLSPIFNGYQSFLASGLPNNGGFIYTYAAGTTTLTATYTTNAGNIANANPIPLSASGVPPNEIWLTTGVSYKFVVTDSTVATIGTYDNIPGVANSGVLPLANGGTGTAAGTASDVRVALGARQIQPLTASVASTALTVSLYPTSLDFRSATLGNGLTNLRDLPGVTFVIVPSGATLGSVSGVTARLVVLAMDNAGTVELAIVNLTGGNNLDETGLISTTAISASASSASVIYSTTARTNLPYRVVAIVDAIQTATAWSTVPSLVQGAGGQALSGIANGQTWQSVIGSRAFGITYYNATGHPIIASVWASTSVAIASYIAATINGVTFNLSNGAAATGQLIGGTVTIPAGAAYSVSNQGNAFSAVSWAELR